METRIVPRTVSRALFETSGITSLIADVGAAGGGGTAGFISGAGGGRDSSVATGAAALGAGAGADGVGSFLSMVIANQLSTTTTASAARPSRSANLFTGCRAGGGGASTGIFTRITSRLGDGVSGCDSGVFTTKPLSLIS